MVALDDSAAFFGGSKSRLRALFLVWEPAKKDLELGFRWDTDTQVKRENKVGNNNRS